MPSKKLTLPDPGIDNLIREIRGVRVILDSDLAALYGVTTKAFNQAVKRNLARFPRDFIFRLIKEEAEVGQSQVSTQDCWFDSNAAHTSEAGQEEPEPRIDTNGCSHGARSPCRNRRLDLARRLQLVPHRKRNRSWRNGRLDTARRLQLGEKQNAPRLVIAELTKLSLKLKLRPGPCSNFSSPSCVCTAMR
jgi:ORF6N domain